MLLGYAAKYQILFSSLLLVALLLCLASVPACKDEKNSPSSSQAIYLPDSISIISASENAGMLSASYEDRKIQLSYEGIRDEQVRVRIYDASNSLVYGEKELTLLVQGKSKLDFEGIVPGSYQIFVFFQDAEFLSTELEIPKL